MKTEAQSSKKKKSIWAFITFCYFTSSRKICIQSSDISAKVKIEGSRRY